MSTPIFDSLVNAIPEVCGSIGPRIGEEGSPRCGEPLDHGDFHRGFPGSGFENQYWGYPVYRDREFAREYAAWLAKQRADLLDF